MDVFVAYSSKDEASVRIIVDWLRRNGLQVWVAYELPAGLDWDTEIDRVLAQIPCVLTVWSPSAVASAEVKGEARAAMARDALVSVSLDAVLPPRSFTHSHAVDLTGLGVVEDSVRTSQVLRGIRTKLDRNTQQHPIVEPSSSDAAAGQEDVPAEPPAARRAPSPWWAYAGGALVAIGAVYFIVGDDAAARPSCDDPGVYKLAGQTFMQDTVIRESVVCIAENAVVRVAGGTGLQIDAETLVVQGKAKFDGRGSEGARGRDGSNGPKDEFSPPRIAGVAVCGEKPPASRYDGEAGGRGGNGGDGARIEIRYRALDGDPSLLTHDVRGGAGGRGGNGGRPGFATCRDIGAFRVNGAHGASGATGNNGRDGSFVLSRITS